MVGEDEGARPAVAAGANEGPAPVEVRMNALRTVTAERNEDRFTLVMAVTVGIPVIVAVSVVLQNSQRDAEYCASPLALWCTVEAVRLGFNIVFYGLTSLLDPTPFSTARRWQRMLQNAEGMVFVVWFMMGNVWLFGSSTCSTTAPQLYALQLALIVLGYISLFLPCALFLVFLPFACCCFPCLIRVLSHLSPSTVTGATAQQLQQLKKVRATADLFPTPEDARCSICLAEYVNGQDSLRWLPCGHHYHVQCGDEWLAINATCPTCRQNPFGGGLEDMV